MTYGHHFMYEPEPPRRRRGWIPVLIVFSIVAAAVGGWAVASLGGDDAPRAAVETTVASTTTTGLSTTTTVSPSSTVAATDVVSEPTISTDTGGAVLVLDASEVGDIVLGSVVTVQVSAGGGSGSGSGVVYDDSGHVITNHHVIEVGSTYQVVLTDGRVYPATLVGSDPVTDLAVLRIDADGLVPVAVGSTDLLDVGDPAIAAGSPLGLEGGPSLTVGVVSAFGRVVQTDATTVLYGMLQTDAPITQGSSGGALVDAEGRLLGITTAVGVSSVGVEGVGFATPVEIVVRVVEELLADGDASETFMGITGSTAFAATGDGGERPIGVEVQSVEPASPSEVAGLVSGDVVTAVGAVPVDTMPELVALLRRHAAGDVVDMTIVSEGVTEIVTLVLASR